MSMSLWSEGAVRIAVARPPGVDLVLNAPWPDASVGDIAAAGAPLLDVAMVNWIVIVAKGVVLLVLICVYGTQRRRRKRIQTRLEILSRRLAQATPALRLRSAPGGFRSGSAGQDGDRGDAPAVAKRSRL